MLTIGRRIILKITLARCHNYGTKAFTDIAIKHTAFKNTIEVLVTGNAVVADSLWDFTFGSWFLDAYI